ncbi:MAG TPA: hypothetical protein VMX55_00020 [candidate division Zixibacteria bacterium]|nr:hypothetical protein [candidate division Zixibacteria bacterium]
MTEEIREENKETIEYDHNKSKRNLGQIVTLIYLVIITLVYLFLLGDGTFWPTIMGWGGLVMFFIALIIETIFGSIVRTTIFIVENFSRTMVFIIINLFFTLIPIGGAVFVFLHEYPHMPVPFLLFFLYPFIISLPINLALLINRETFSNWSKWSSKETILSKRELKILQISITFFSITFFATILVSPFFIWIFSYYLLIPIACYYSWFIFCEIIWKRIALMKIRDNDRNTL